MDFKDILFVTDFDNTLTGEGHLVPQENLDAILSFTTQGGAFTIASGRGKREWRESFEGVPINAPLILSNGATIYDTFTDQVLYHALLTEEQKDLVTKLFLSLPKGCGGLIEAEERVYIPEEIWETTPFRGFPGSSPLHLPFDEIPHSWDKVSFISELGPLPPPGEWFDLSRIDVSGLDQLQRQAEESGIAGLRSLPVMYEIPPAGIDKGISARKLLELLGKKVLVCAGDAPNDLAMLEEADYCFVPCGSILTESDIIPEGAILTVKCEEAAIADAMRHLKEL